jgi:hypothetical protein
MQRSTAIRFGLLITCAAALPVPALAQSDVIFVCADDQGHKTYQNTGGGKGCQRVDGVVATVPAPRVNHNAELTRGVSPASFPRIDGDTQKMRDADRHQILEEELRAEQERLARLRTEFNNGQPQPAADEVAGSASYRERTQRLLEDIQRAETNVASLRRELSPQRF